MNVWKHFSDRIGLKTVIICLNIGFSNNIKVISVGQRFINWIASYLPYYMELN